MTPEALLADVRGVALEQMPKDLPFPDVERIASELPADDIKLLIASLIETLAAPVEKKNGDRQGAESKK